MSAQKPNVREDGLTLIELISALSVIVIGLMAIAAILLSTNRQQEQDSARLLVLARAEALLEEIKGSSPDTILATYNGQQFGVEGITGSVNPDQVISVAVDDADPTLLVIAVTGSWFQGNGIETMTLTTEIFDAGG